MKEVLKERRKFMVQNAPTGITGRKFENWFFGIECEMHATDESSFSRLNLERIAFGQALQKAISNQPRIGWNPKCPRPGTAAAELFNIVRENLPKNFRQSLMMVVGVGTILDYIHGVDGLLMLNGTRGCVTFDITLKTHKRVMGGRKHLVLTRSAIENGWIEVFGQDIADYLSRVRIKQRILEKMRKRLRQEEI